MICSRMYDRYNIQDKGFGNVTMCGANISTVDAKGAMQLIFFPDLLGFANVSLYSKRSRRKIFWHTDGEAKLRENTEV